MSLLATAQESLVLVGGIDSLCDPQSLRQLALADRILGRGNPDGALPGEGGGFLLLSAQGDRWRWVPPLATLLGVALAHEPYGYANQAPSRADGLTTALRALREHPLSGCRRVDLLVHGQTGESFWAKELARAYLRNAALCPEPFRPRSIADSLGDTGCAAGIIATATAVGSLAETRLGSPQNGRALVYGCSDDGQVGACVVEALA